MSYRRARALVDKAVAQMDEPRKNDRKTRKMPEGKRFEAGNPGRPKGSRNKLGEHFIQDLYADWREHGATVIAKVRADDPATYLKVTASILPKELHIKDSTLDDVADEHIARLLGAIADERARRNRAENGNGAPAPAGQERPDSVH